MRFTTGAGVPRNRNVSISGGNGWSINRTTIDLPLVCINCLRCSPSAICLANGVNVAHLVLRAIAIHCDNSIARKHSRCLATLAYAFVELRFICDLSACVDCCVTQCHTDGQWLVPI